MGIADGNNDTPYATVHAMLYKTEAIKQDRVAFRREPRNTCKVVLEVHWKQFDINRLTSVDNEFGDDLHIVMRSRFLKC